MKRRQSIVVIESPYAGDVDANVAYARDALRDSLLRGEAPFASHLLYTQPGVLNDAIERDRNLGLEAGWAFFQVADWVAVYQDLGISRGMEAGILRAMEAGLRVEYRNIRPQVRLRALDN